MADFQHHEKNSAVATHLHHLHFRLNHRHPDHRETGWEDPVDQEALSVAVWADKHRGASPLQAGPHPELVHRYGEMYVTATWTRLTIQLDFQK